MKGTLAAIAALLISTSAFAGGYELECGKPVTFIGEDPNDNNPVTQIAVKYVWDNHSWLVVHQLRNGAVVSRGNQYGITDTSNSIKTQWQGRLLRQPWLFMIGEIKKSADGLFTYNEWMYDTKQGNQLVMQSASRCTARQVQQLPTPTVQAEPPTPVEQGNTVVPKGVQTLPYTQQPPGPMVNPKVRDSVKIVVGEGGRSVHVDVLLGGMPIRMLVDTGAMASQIPPTFASMLLRSGAAEEAGTTNVRYANGTRAVEQVLRIRDLRIGGHTIRNIMVTVSDGPPLIGFPIINSIAPFTIDTRVGELVWHTNG